MEMEQDEPSGYLAVDFRVNYLVMNIIGNFYQSCIYDSSRRIELTRLLSTVQYVSRLQ